MTLQIGMSAADARAQGIPVDAEVPDCAVLTSILGDAENIQASTGEGSRISLQIPVRPGWSWVSVTAELKQEGGGDE